MAVATALSAWLTHPTESGSQLGTIGISWSDGLCWKADFSLPESADDKYTPAHTSQNSGS